MQGTTTSDNYIYEAQPQRSERRVSEQSPDSPIHRLADALLDRGVEEVSVPPARERANEVLCATVNGRPVVVWASGPSFLTGCWRVLGSTSGPDKTADRMIAGPTGDGR